MTNSHILILKSFDELRFNLGKKTLIDFVKGNTNPTISRNNLDELNSYGELYMIDEREIEEIIDQLIKFGYLDNETITMKNGFETKVVSRNIKGRKEIFEKKFKLQELGKVKLDPIFNREVQISEEDKKIFKSFDFFLGKFNNEQKKAIISESKNLLCIAGAGSGKTTVLTKKIEYLVKFKGVNEKDILAITFTKKSKEDLIKKLNENDILNSNVETFNSFCEKILRKNENEIYGQNMKILSFGQKIKLVKYAFNKTGLNFEAIVDLYFNKKKKQEKSNDELLLSFTGDVFSIIDFYKNHDIKFEKFYEMEKNLAKKNVSKIVYTISAFIAKILRVKGFRDFSDQVLDVLKFFREREDKISKFKYVLVDEFQDVNHIQFELLKILKKENLFAVGDPRQAIYGWRGAEVKYILNFNKEFNDVEIINLKMNYRSDKEIVDLFNNAIKPMDLVDLEASKNEESENRKTFLVEHQSELLERQFILESIRNSKNPFNEIFILARTNKILNKYEDLFSQNGIPHKIKSEEEYKNKNDANLNNAITLATIHSIKGMEANEVYLVNANSNSFPNRTPDNFVFATIKESQEYDKDEEELRLFYVALSRAKEKLIISYNGKYTKFINPKMIEQLSLKKKKSNKDLFSSGINHKSKSLSTSKSNSTILRNMIKDWRLAKSKTKGLPAFYVLSDATLEELVRQMPQSKAEMFSVKGLGQMKIGEYGDELLRIINGGN